MQPRNPIPHVNLGNTFLDEGDAIAARAHFEEALALDATLAEAHQGMSYVFARLGDEEAAAPHRQLGFRERAVTVFPFRGEAAPVRTTLLVSALGGNVGTGLLLDDRIFSVTRIFVDYYSQPRLSDSDVIFNAIGDADRCEDALQRAQELVGEGATPVVNAPAAVLATQRASVTLRCAGIPGARVPKTVIVPRAALRESPSPVLAEHGFTFPLLLRALGFHTGRYMERVATLEELRDVAARLPGKNLAVIEYLETRGADGNFRKYRTMLVDGRLFPLHLAVAGDWKVHYFTAGMAHATEHQEEERRFLEHMEDTLGPSACAALREISGRLGLDYGGIDFSLDGDGNVALFEANATMIVPSRETDERLAYRRPYLQTVIEAVRAMVRTRAAKSI
ncbi:MAG: hypothetical protein ACRENA_01845 [Vulcanimicrobiaceae bacterium]